ncbi:MAG: DUF1080 domain-containing protein [Acidobacteriaceae bacterium]|nr:DUF1080 domain-containing protein [Acidobacteriaceae bacterium]
MLVVAFCAVGWSAEPGFESLFNGKNLDGWEADVSNVWSVRDAMIVGKTAGLDFNDFLRTKRDYGDFVLKARFRLVDNIGNSGIQFRSKPVPGSHEVSGYQADVGQNYWASLYDESRRKKTLMQAPESVVSKIDKSGWNEYTITAQGNHITLDLNGTRVVDYTETDPSVEKTGFIALQVHRGFAMEVQFKDVRIRTLSGTP